MGCLLREGRGIPSPAVEAKGGSLTLRSVSCGIVAAVSAGLSCGALRVLRRLKGMWGGVARMGCADVRCRSLRFGGAGLRAGRRARCASARRACPVQGSARES